MFISRQEDSKEESDKKHMMEASLAYDLHFKHLDCNLSQ